MKIGIRGGHSPNCKGAMGMLDEQESVRALSYAVTPLLQQAGHVVIDCNSNAGDANGELNEGTNKANNNGCDIYITLHMNAFNGSANGVEVLVFDDASQMANAIANRACANLSSLGLLNRGVKQRRDLHDLTVSNMQACLIEVLFCDSGKDVAIWNKQGLQKIAVLIANAIDPNIKTYANADNKAQENLNPKNTTEISYRGYIVRGGMALWTDWIKNGAMMGKKGDVVLGFQLWRPNINYTGHVENYGAIKGSDISNSHIIGSTDARMRLEQLTLFCDNLPNGKSILIKGIIGGVETDWKRGSIGSVGMNKPIEGLAIKIS